MTKMLCIFLAFAMLLSGCGRSGAATEPTVAATEAPATVAATTVATEPTLSPEEILYDSLTDRQRLAVDLGIVALDRLADPEAACTIREVAQLFQNAYRLHHGSDSRLLEEVMALECGEEPAFLGWIGRLPAALYVEDLEPEGYQDMDQWLGYVLSLAKKDLADDICAYSGSSGYAYLENGNTFVRHSYHWYDVGWSQGMGKYLYRNAPEDNALLQSCMGQGNLLACSALLRDATTGYKVLEVSLEDTVDVAHVMTLADAVEMALRLRFCFWQEPELAGYDDCRTPDPTILTPELLARETTLPDATCAGLPSQWHGVTMDQLSRFRMGGPEDLGHYDAEIYEYEIQAIQDTGFNYIALQLDFSWLQGGNGFSRLKPLDGQLDLSRLKQLDQLLVWCMERDIHLDIRCTGVGGMIPYSQERWQASESTAKSFAEIWSVLAQRYAQVPNAYLSFTVMDAVMYTTTGGNGFAYGVNGLGVWQKDMVAFVRPSVEAIRAISPDRCLILDISGYNVGTDVVELGVALSTDLSDMNNTFFAPKPGDTRILTPEYYATVTWPAQGLTGVADLLEAKQSWQEGSTAAQVMALAKENGLGYMVSGWGLLLQLYKGAEYCAARYPDETYENFITDVTETLASLDYGWCYEEWYGHNGIVYSVPITKNVTYEAIGDYPLYYDTALRDIFQRVNGIAK